MYHPFERLIAIKGFHTFFEYCYPEDYYFGGEHHDFWEAVYCLNGSVGISADDKVYRLCPGDITLHPPMVYHRLWAEDHSRPHMLIFSFEAEGALLPRISRAYSCSSALQEQWNFIYRLIKESACRRSLTGFLHYLEQEPYTFQQVANLCENNLLALEREGLPLGYNQTKSAADYNKIICVMKEHLQLALTVEELSRICGLSVSSMKKLFRQYNTMGVHEYFLHLKMNEAMRLLERGKTVTETAELLGFSDQSYFSTAFKRRMKESPGRFRRNKNEM